jgi:hypothetical protein
VLNAVHHLPGRLLLEGGFATVIRATIAPVAPQPVPTQLPDGRTIRAGTTSHFPTSAPRNAATNWPGGDTALRLGYSYGCRSGRTGLRRVIRSPT